MTLTRQLSRQLDRRASEEFGLPGIVLMENAGRGVAEGLLALGCQGPVAICCGKGNNGGDGFVIARHLDLAGLEVRVLLFAEPKELAGDAAVNFRVVQAAEIPLHSLAGEFSGAALDERLASSKLIVDALLGTGARGDPRPPLDEVIDHLNQSGVPLAAVDVPSGLDCDTGRASPHTVRAGHTFTFVAAKPGLLAPAARRYVGELHVVQIGAPRKLVEELTTQAPQRKRARRGLGFVSKGRFDVATFARTQNKPHSGELQRLAVQAPGLRGHDAQILVACGYKDPAAIAAANPAALLAAADAFANTSQGQWVVRSGKPDQAEVARWMEWARQAQPPEAA